MPGARDDPLMVFSSRVCPSCKCRRRRRKKCECCEGAGFERADLANLWAPRPGFLVGGGPSLKNFDVSQLAQRGVVSLGINNVAGAVPVRAHVFGDPQVKFHHGLFLDPAMMTFCPIGKMPYGLRAKLPDGTFRALGVSVWQCPNTWGFSRTTRFDAENFLATEYAHWGQSAKSVPPELGGSRRITTMLLGLRLLHYLGCPRVYLIGVDFFTPKVDPKLGGSYVFPEVTNPGNRGYDKINAMLSEIKPVFEAADFMVYNVNPESRCHVFDHVPFDLALADCRGPVPKQPWDLQNWYPKSLEKEWKDAEKQRKRDGIDAMTQDELTVLQEAIDV